jgi:hypothetical protein
MIIYTGLPTDVARRYQSGGQDAYGNAPEQSLSEGAGNPCRHCLGHVPEGRRMLILAHRPFSGFQPYAETGPIFLCSDSCEGQVFRHLPEVLKTARDYLIKGYTADERIFYGTGEVVTQADLEMAFATRLEDPRVAFVDIRSSRNNCWIARARRGG